MTKSLFSAAAISALLLVSGTAFAADCATEMKATEAAIMKLTDSGMKSLATQKMLLAKERMAEKNEAACMAQVTIINKDIGVPAK